MVGIGELSSSKFKYKTLNQ